LLVVLDEKFEPLASEALHLTRVLHLGQDPVHTEILEARHPIVVSRYLLHLERQLSFSVRAGEVGWAVAPTAHADPALSAPQLGKDGALKFRPGHVDGVGEHDDRTRASDEQGTNTEVASGPPHGMEEQLVVAVTSPAFDDNDVVGALEVIAEGLGMGEGTFFIRASEEFLHKVSAQSELGLRQTTEAGQLHGQDSRPVLDSHELMFSRHFRGIEEGEDADDVVAGLG
jgi:hypothetical protein